MNCRDSFAPLLPSKTSQEAVSRDQQGTQKNLPGRHDRRADCFDLAWDSSIRHCHSS